MYGASSRSRASSESSCSISSILIRTPASQHSLQFFSSSQHICFHGAERNVENARGFVVREAVLAAEHNGAPFMDGKQLESARKIMAESGIDGLRIVFRFQLSFIDANQLLSFPRFFPVTIVGDSVEPGRKTRFAAEAAEVFVGPQKRLLREVVRGRNIGAGQLAWQTWH